jgi:hypothetical protein
MTDENAVQEHEEATPDAPEATADATIEGEDAEVASTVDDITVDKLMSDTKSPQPAGTEGDPIGEAEDHIASLDMDAERQKAADLMKKL